MKRILRVLGISLVSFFLLLFGGSLAIYTLVDFDELVNEKVEEFKPTVEESLGRSLELGTIRTSFFPSLSVEIPDIQVNGEEGGPPLLEVESVSVDIAIWQAILSLGKRLEVKKIVVSKPRVSLVRKVDGSLSVDDLLSSEPSQKESEPFVLPDGLRLSLLQIRDGSILFHDETTRGVSEISSLSLSIRDLSADRPIHLDVSLAAFAKEKNLELSLVAGPLGALPPRETPTLRSVRFDATSVDLTPLAPYLGEQGAQIENARLTASLRIPVLSATSPLEVEASAQVEGAKLSGGDPFDLETLLRAKFDPSEEDLSIEAFRLALGGMEIAAKGDIRSLGSVPRVEDFELKSERIDLGALLRFVPALGSALPEGSKVEGPLHLEVSASGTKELQAVQASVDLGKADLWLPGVFAKGPTVPLALSFDGSMSPSGASIRDLRFTLAGMELVASGEVPTFDPVAAEIAFEAKPFAFDELVRLAPSVHEGLKASGASAKGQGSLQGHLKSGEGKVDARLEIALLGAELEVEETKIDGDLRFTSFAKGEVDGALEAGVYLDASGARLLVDGLVDKNRQDPMVVDIVGEKNGDRLSFSRFDFRLGALRLEPRGSLALAKGASALEVGLPRVDLGELARTFPFLPEEWRKGGHLEGVFSFQGGPEDLSTIRASIPSFSGQIGASDFQLSASIENLKEPVLEGHLRSNHLDLDALRGEAPDDEGAAVEKEREEREDNPELKKLTANIGIDVRRARFTGRDLENVVGRIVVRDGVLLVEEARFGMYGGEISAAGSKGEFWMGKIPFSVRLQVRQVDVQAAIVGETGKQSPLSGRGNIEMALEGSGTDRQDLEENLHGTWTLSLSQGRLEGPDLRSAILGDFDALPVFASSRLKQERSIRDLVGFFEVADGKMNLKEPLAFNLGGDKILLSGAIGIFGDLFLDGSYLLSPSAVSTLSGGRCRSGAPLEIPVTITGAPSAPKFRGDGVAIAREIAKTCLSQGAKDALEQVGQDVVQKARQQVDAAKAAADAEAAKARQEAEAAAREAKAEAEKKARELQQEAERQKREAEKKAKQKAKEAAGGLRKRLGF